MAKKNKKDEELTGLNKYRFIFVGVACVFLIVFGVVMTFQKDFAEQLIFYLTGGLILIFGIIRFVPMVRYLFDKRRLVMNVIEIFSNILIAIAILYMATTYPTASSESAANAEVYGWIYKITVAIVLGARGIIFMAEGIYCEGEKEKTKFAVHVIFIMASAAILMPGFNITNIKWLLIAISFLAGVYCGIDTYFSFNRYRRLYVNKEKEVEYNKEVEKEKTKEINVPQPEQREETYVN